MKKEIKFRAWDKESQKMIYDIQNNINYGKFSFPFIINNDRFSVMQFTGITDQNKVDIYEGDILSDRWNVEVYQNDEGTFMVKFGTNPKMNKHISLKQYLLKREKAGTSICEGYRDCIVISNIYEAKNKPS